MSMEREHDTDLQMSGDAQYANLPLLSTFLKHFNRAYLGFAEKTGEDQATGHGAIGPSPDLPEGVTELIPIGLQKEFREMFVSYFTTASKTLVKGHLVRRVHAQRGLANPAESLGSG
jgi:regulator of nonsense transcripts 2